MEVNTGADGLVGNNLSLFKWYIESWLSNLNTLYGVRYSGVDIDIETRGSRGSPSNMYVPSRTHSCCEAELELCVSSHKACDARCDNGRHNLDGCLQSGCSVDAACGMRHAACRSFLGYRVQCSDSPVRGLD